MPSGSTESGMSSHSIGTNGKPECGEAHSREWNTLPLRSRYTVLPAVMSHNSHTMTRRTRESTAFSMVLFSVWLKMSPSGSESHVPTLATESALGPFSPNHRFDSASVRNNRRAIRDAL